MDRWTPSTPSATRQRGLDVQRDSDVPISTQIFWQLAYQIDSGRLQPGVRLAPVRELGAALRVNPNTIRAVYRRLADAGYVTSRHGAGHGRRRPTAAARGGRRRSPGSSSEMLRRAAQAGFTPDEVAAATFAAAIRAEATRRRRSASSSPSARPPTPGYDAERLNGEFAGSIEAEGTLLDELPERLDRFHYDLVATTTFHADEAQALVGGRVPVVAMLVGPGYVELVHEIPALPEGSRRRRRLRVGSRRGEHRRDAVDRRDDAGSSSSPRRSTTRSGWRSSIGPPTSSSCRGRRSPRASTRRWTDPSGSGRGRTSSIRPGSSSCGAPSPTRWPAGPWSFRPRRQWPPRARRHPSPRCGRHPWRERRADRHKLEPPLVATDGSFDARNATAARRIAARLNVDRVATAEPLAAAGDVTALAALDAVLHRIVERERDAGRVDLDRAIDRAREAAR